MKTITVKAHIDLDEVQRVYDELTEGEDWQHEAICIRHPIMKTDSYALEAHDLALWLSTLKRLLVKESKRSKAQSKCCDATIVVRGSWYECEACGEVVTAEPTMTKDERGEIRANLDAPRWKCVACGHMEKGHLTSAAQGGRACPECGKRHFWTGGFKEAAAHGFSPRAALRRALDTIDALEAKLELQPCPECEGKGGEVSGFGPGGADREYCECPFCDDRLELPALEIEAIKHKWDAEHSDLFKFEAERDRDQWRERAEKMKAERNQADMRFAILAQLSAQLEASMPETLERLELLKRGRITQEHAEMVTPEMLATYLNGSDRWTWHEADDDYREHWRIGDDLHGRVCPGDAHKWAIQNIAHKENRGELAVWCEVMREGE